MLNCVSKELYLELLFGHARQRGDRRFMILLTKRKERPLVPLFRVRSAGIFRGLLLILKLLSRESPVIHILPFAGPCLVQEPRNGPTSAPCPLLLCETAARGTHCHAHMPGNAENVGARVLLFCSRRLALHSSLSYDLLPSYTHTHTCANKHTETHGPLGKT